MFVSKPLDPKQLERERILLELLKAELRRIDEIVEDWCDGF